MINSKDSKPRTDVSRRALPPSGVPGLEGDAGATVLGGPVLTKGELAVALKVSVRTVERMVAVGDIRPLGGRGWLVRFYLPDVVAGLQRGERKFGRRAGTGS